MASDAASDEEFEREFEELAQIYDVLRRDALHLIKDLDDGVWAFRLGALLMFSLTAGFAGYSAYFFLLWGAFIFFTVGDKEPAEWDYHVISDVPGESPYSTRVTKHFFGIPIQPFQQEMKSKPEHEPGQGEKK